MVKTAFLFPGQGSQSVGMGRSLLETSPAASDLARSADEALGFSLTALCLEGPEEELKRTLNSQPAILLVSLCALAALRERVDLTPDVAAGHSLGEYSALVAADALEPLDALRLVRRRGELMDQAAAAHPGAMAAVIGLPAEELLRLCEAEPETVGIANYNSPEQLIVSGTSEGVARLGAAAKAAGAKRVLPLAVSGGFHSPLMDAAAEGLGEALAGVRFREPRVRVIANVTAEPVPSAAALPDLLKRQVTGSVRWHESVQRMAALGVTRFVELGPGKVLSNLLRRSFPEVTVLNVEDAASLETTASALAQGGP